MDTKELECYAETSLLHSELREELESDSKHEKEFEKRDTAVRLKVTILSNDQAYWHTCFSIASTLWPLFHYCSLNTGTRHGIALVRC